ncbi:MAG: YggS family pyridoxal phosphate-dependent enzyme [Sulfurovum sp.]|nr:YggS family pyridoxal phosphate-dependent enzyme [Sulfurovum sp.]
MNIADRIQTVRQDIQTICSKYNININDLKLLAVSKTHSADAIQAAYDAGITEFGESYLQEALEKIRELHALSIQWHFIGPIQSNKTRQIATHFDWVQSVDRSKLLTRLSEQRPAKLAALNVCIQVNYFEEPQKKGVAPSELVPLLEMADQLPNINLRGLMAIPPKKDDFSEQLEQFRQITSFYEECKNSYPKMDTLSIGMSADMEAALVAGSNMVRVGTAIFGARG